MKANDLTTLVHLVGFITGIALYAMLGLMTLRTRRGGGGGARDSRGAQAGADRIPLATAMLGLLWNSGALVIYGVRDLGLTEPVPWLTAVAFSALGFLPAVVVHSAVQSLRPARATHRLVATAYTLSGAASAIQLYDAALARALPSRPALYMLTVGYALIIAALAALMRRQPGWRRALSAVALAAFAVMALHLSQHPEEGGTDSWLMELVGHHASLPLALVILVQDYRFALADLFLKRVLALVALVAIAALLHLTVLAPHILPVLARDATDPRAAGELVALWVATALAYPFLWRGIDRFVDRLVLRRTDYARLRAELAARIATLDTAEEVLDATAAMLAPALNARRITWLVEEREDRDGAPIVVRTGDGRQEVAVRVATADAPSFVLEVGELVGGRRLLSDDLALLESVALTLARRIDAVRITHERVERGVRESEMLQLATEAELRALRAQLNPHFLFNTLTTIGYLMQEAPAKALETLYRLTGLLRAVLKRSAGEFTTLGEELELVRSYLAIEHARFEERLGVTIDVPAELASHRIPPLLLQPIVENSIKHGIAPRQAGGTVVITARVETSVRGDGDDTLVLSVIDTGVGTAPDSLRRRRAVGIGLSNIERRLDRYYGGRASLAMRSAVGVGTTVEIRLPLGDAPHALTPAGAGAASAW